ncbi:perlucin-like [Diadema setosum]|uniref:perlucin-like n=1 Tax=Diadema setosum TaxID=31175 RepID=UPI003B3A9E9A
MTMQVDDDVGRRRGPVTLVLIAIVWTAAVGVTMSKGQLESYTCPAGFIKVNSSCYYFSEGVADRDDAKASCESVGASLASITSADEQAAVTDYVIPYGKGADFWIGMGHLDPLQFEWVDGTPLNYTNWGDEFDPNNDGTDCIRMDGENSFHWHDRSCADKFHFICEKSKESDGSCGMSFDYTFGSSCYYALPNSDSAARDLASAILWCTFQASTPVIINSAEEEQFIQGLAKTIGK